MVTTKPYPGNPAGGDKSGGATLYEPQFAGPMTAWWKVLGQPVLTPEVQKKIMDSVHAEAGSRSIEELEAERNQLLLGLVELRTKPDNANPTSQAAALAS